MGKIKERAQDTSPTSGAVIKGFFLISSPAAYKIEFCFYEVGEMKYGIKYNENYAPT